MGAHTTENEVLDPETRAYNEFMNSGKDFEKIELYAYAIKKYTEALGVKPNDKTANAQIYECKKKLKHDNKIVAIVLVVAIVAVGVFLLI